MCCNQSIEQRSLNVNFKFNLETVENNMLQIQTSILEIFV